MYVSSIWSFKAIYMYIQNKLQPSYTEINKYKNQSSLINIKNNAQCNITAGEARLFNPPPPIMLKYLSGKHASIFDHNKTRKLKFSSMFNFHSLYRGII